MNWLDGYNNPGEKPESLFLDLGDADRPWRGFGSTFFSFQEPELCERPGDGKARGRGDALPLEVRDELLRLAYQETGLTRGRCAPFRYDRLAEVPCGAAEMETRGLDRALDYILAARPFGLSELTGMEGRVPAAMAGSGVRTLWPECYDLYVERVIALLLHWRDVFGVTLAAWALYNEPHYPLNHPPLLSPEGHVELTKRLGRALERAGLETRLYVADDWSPRHRTLDIARAVLADAEARSFVLAAGYHGYDGYDNTAHDRSTFSDQRAARRELRALCDEHGVELWMTELSHFRTTTSEWDDIAFLAGAVTDDLNEGGVHAWDFMLAVWQGNWRRNERGGPQAVAEFYYEPDGTVRRTQLTRVATAMGHWSRVVRPGWRRIGLRGAGEDLPATAFVDPDGRRCACVLLNQPGPSRRVTLRLEGGAPAESPGYGFRSNPIERWGEIGEVIPGGDHWVIDLPVHSLTTVVLPIVQ